MKKLAIVCLLLVVIVTLTAGTAMAWASVFTEKIIIDVSGEISEDPALTGCTGEPILHTSGIINLIIRTVVDNNGIGHLTIHKNVSNVKAIGIDSGEEFIAVDTQNLHAKESILTGPPPWHVQNNWIWMYVSLKSGITWKSKLNAHLIIDEEFNVILDRYELDEECFED